MARERNKPELHEQNIQLLGFSLFDLRKKKRVFLQSFPPSKEFENELLASSNAFGFSTCMSPNKFMAGTVFTRGSQTTNVPVLPDPG